MNKLNDDEDNMILRLQEFNILKKIKNCRECGTHLRMVTRKRNKDDKNPKKSWRCINSKCQAYTSPFDGSFFQLFRKPFLVILELIKFWSVQMTLEKSSDFLKINKIANTAKMIGILFRRLRNICSGRGYV